MSVWCGDAIVGSSWHAKIMNVQSQEVKGRSSPPRTAAAGSRADRQNARAGPVGDGSGPARSLRTPGADCSPPLWIVMAEA